MSYKEIGKRMGISHPMARKHTARAHARGLSKPHETQATPGTPVFEHKNPEKAAEIVDRLTDRPQYEGWLSIAETARQCGVPQSVARLLNERLESRYLPLKLIAESVKIGPLRDLFGTVARRVLESIHPDDIKKASLKDKLIAAGIATDKFNVLSDRPTEIIRSEEYHINLDESAMNLIKEIKRRGMEIEINPETQQPKLSRETPDG